MKHARKYLADSEPEHIAAVKKCMGLLAFPISTSKSTFINLTSKLFICKDGISDNLFGLFSPNAIRGTPQP